jgi:predicted MFS family arabinose efflux permease
MMYLGASYVLFFLGCSVFGFYWNFYLTLHLGVIARSDGTGRGIVLCGVAPSVGAIIGSFLGGTLVRGVDYQLLAWMGGMLCIIGVACAVATITRMKPANAVAAMPS